MSFGAIKCHFIDQEMNLQSLILNFRKIAYLHDASALSIFLLETIDTFELRSRVVAITSDNLSSNISAMQIVKDVLDQENDFGLKTFHLGCLSHVVNQPVIEALKALKQSIFPFDE